MRRYQRHESCAICDVFDEVDRWGPAVVPAPHIPSVQWLDFYDDTRSRGVPDWHPESSGGSGSVQAADGDGRSDPEAGSPDGPEGP